MIQNSLLRFNGKWRSYQKRILDNLEAHLCDKKLHVVAAPGAGKTTLGIEVISRISQPSLILCPTNTIKTQWKERILSSFLEEKDYGIVSTNIREPKYITIITYQALLAAFCGETDDNDSEHYDEDEDSITSSSRFVNAKANEIIDLLRQADISLLCFDEAHHLRKEWWRALRYLNEHLKPKQTIALTATPPYDVDYNEWKRYQDLCGEIDEEISIPELVKNGDLCPHQDFIFLSCLKKEERNLIVQHNENVRSLIEELQNDAKLLDLLSGMDFFNAGDSDIELIYDTPEFYISIASLLNSRGYEIPTTFLDLFDMRQKDLPKFDVNMASQFFDGLLQTKHESFDALTSYKEHYFNTAKRLGLVANKKIALNDSIKIRRQIAGSLSKLDSIVEIVKLESEQLQQKLRMVILTDRIRRDDMECTGIGVIPIWKTLNDNFGTTIPMGILCGSLIIIPKSTIGKLYELLSNNGIDTDSIAINPFLDFEDYIMVTPKENVRNQIVSIITDMFNAGEVTILIGTQALLGEGWDAPTINSLILSSTVSSYMLSNQMRGRAIRINANDPEKVSNIWHLATIDIPEVKELTPTSEDAYANQRSCMYDIEQLVTRFDGFEAPAYKNKHEIVSGIDRITDIYKVLPQIQSAQMLQNMTATHQRFTLSLARNRAQTRQWWNEALHLGYGNSKQIGLKSGVQTGSMTIKSLQYTSYKYYLFILSMLLLIAITYHPAIIYLVFTTKLGWFCLAAILALYATIVIKFLKTGTVAGILKQISIVILESLSKQGEIKSSLKNVGITVNNDSGTLFVSCSNLSSEENNLFIRCLQEFLDPIENPRYLLVKHDVFMERVRQKDYFSIPTVLSANKSSINTFKFLWEKYIGKCDIIYTRNREGHKTLLKARKEAFSASNKKWSKLLSMWQ